MARQGTSQTLNGKKIVGAGLLIAGAGVMLAYLGLLGVQITAFLHASPVDLFGSCFGVGLAALRLIPSVAFNHAAVFSLASKILVLFSAFAAIVAGLALLQNRVTTFRR